jgi:hypothetical protein
MNNVTYDWMSTGAATNRTGDCLRATADSTAPSNIMDKTVFANNYCVNIGGDGMRSDMANGHSDTVTWTGNYVSNVYHYCGHFGRYFGNVIRNCSMDNGANSDIAIYDPRVMEGNFVNGDDDVVAAGAGCGTGCTSHVTYLIGDATYFANPPTITFSDNVFRAGDGASLGACQTITSGNLNTATITNAHMTCDGNGTSKQGANVQNDNPTTAQTWSLTDALFLNLNNQNSIACGADADLTDTVGSWANNLSATTAEKAGGISGTCSSNGTQVTLPSGFTLRDRLNYDYGMTTGSPALTDTGLHPLGR